MTFRSWIAGAALLVALSPSLSPGNSAAAEPVTLKFSHFLGPQSFFQVDVVEPWAKELEAATGGAVKVEILDGTSPLGKVFDQASNVKSGAVDIALGLRGAEGDRFPGTSVIELPFVVPSALRGSQALWGLYQDGTLAAEYADYKVLALFVHNPGLIHTKDKRVINLSDLRGLRLRSPSKTVAAALIQAEATPVVLQVNDVMLAVKENKIDGVVTNWGNPLQGFNDYLKFHTEAQFYASAFFIVMNRPRYDGLPPQIRAAIDGLSGERWVAKFGPLWDKWDKPVREGANAPGHEVIVPDAATMESWRRGLAPVADWYLGDLAAHGFPAARTAYDKLAATLSR